MSEPRRLTLSKPWGGHAKGATLTCWRAGDELAAGVVDPARFAALVASGHGAENVAAPAVTDASKLKKGGR